MMKVETTGYDHQTRPKLRHDIENIYVVNISITKTDRAMVTIGYYL